MDNNERCDKCGGFIITDGRDLKCFNCGKRFFQKDKLAVYYTIKCKKCGAEFTAPNKNKKVCKNCERKLYRKLKICSVCGKEFIAKSSKTHKCLNCRTPNRNEGYIRKNQILSNNLRKFRSVKNEKTNIEEFKSCRVLCKHSIEQ